MAGELSLLIFSKDNVDKAISLAKDMYDYVDEIIIVDSSNSKAYKMLFKKKAEKKLGKLRIFYAVALGYPDPLRMYALKKCRYSWVLMLDTDERLSNELKIDLHKTIRSAGHSAFAIRRYEEVGKNFRGAYINWQTRLFRREKITFRGIIHEEPIVNGSVHKLQNSKYSIDHISELRNDTASQYIIMEKFLRMSYESYNERMLDYFYKTTVPSRPDKPGSFGGTLKALLLLYQKLGGKKAEHEVSGFDYFVFFYLMNLVTELKSHRVSGFLTGFKDAKTRLEETRKWQNESFGRENFEISKILYKIGLIRFLELDKEGTILALNRKYKNKKQGIELLIRLLIERYEMYYKGGKA